MNSSQKKQEKVDSSQTVHQSGHAGGKAWHVNKVHNAEVAGLSFMRPLGRASVQGGSR
jgi:hypothetical protein